ncbi:MAG: lipopolysaccharide biosynthesis protein [Alsobacter sp.]
MLFSLAFLANAGLNFVLGLAIAAVLGPEEFGRYALAAAIAILVNALGFFWIANATARFYSERSRAEEPSVRATLDRALLVLGGAVILVALGVLAFWPGWGLGGDLVAIALVVGIVHGVFDYASALSRARFLQGVFARIVLVKNVLGFGMMLGAAVWLQDARAVLAALAVSTILALLPVSGVLLDKGDGRFEPARLRTFMLYAGPHVLALAVYQFIPFINRSLLADAQGYAESGQFSLAFDTLYRIFSAIGSSLDYILFQFAVRDEDRHGSEAADRRLGKNLVIVLAALLPALVGFWMVMPALAAVMVPAAFREGFLFYGQRLLPAVIALAFVVSALNAVFQIRRRTMPIIAVAALALLVNGGLVVALPALIGQAAYPLAQSGAMLAVLAATLALTWPVLRRVVPLRDPLLIALATGLMALALWPLRQAGLAPAVALASMLVVGAAAYAAVIAATNVGGWRDLVRDRAKDRGGSRLAPRPHAPPAAE